MTKKWTTSFDFPSMVVIERLASANNEEEGSTKRCTMMDVVMSVLTPSIEHAKAAGYGESNNT